MWWFSLKLWINKNCLQFFGFSFSQTPIWNFGKIGNFLSSELIKASFALLKLSQERKIKSVSFVKFELNKKFSNTNRYLFFLYFSSFFQFFFERIYFKKDHIFIVVFFLDFRNESRLIKINFFLNKVFIIFSHYFYSITSNIVGFVFCFFFVSNHIFNKIFIRRINSCKSFSFK